LLEMLQSAASEASAACAEGCPTVNPRSVWPVQQMPIQPKSLGKKQASLAWRALVAGTLTLHFAGRLLIV
jgi:hypothetical protein